VAEVAETTSETGGSIRLKTHDKVKALELIGKHLGMFTDKIEVTGKDGAALSVTVYMPSNGRNDGN
jgi:phage terminase small subunit